MNKISFLILGGLALIIFLNLNTGCKKEPTETEYIIGTDSVKHADTILSGTQFNVEFYGKVGDNDCYELNRIEPVFGFDFIEVTIVGKHTDRSDCGGNPSYMNPAAVGFLDMTPGEWTIKVIQPEGEQVQESIVFVK